MIRFLLDTNTVSYLLRGHPEVVRRVVAAPMPSLCVSALTEAELLYGLAKRPEAKRLRAAVWEFLRRVDVLAWDSDVAERYGALRAELERQGKSLAPLDLLIAAHALTLDAVLVTSDSAFHRISDLRLEDWTS